MKIGEAKNRAKALWGDQARVQVRPPRFQVIVPAKETDKFVLVGEGEDWEMSLADSKKIRNDVAAGAMKERESKPWYHRLMFWKRRDQG